MGNPAEETCCYPNTAMLQFGNSLSILNVAGRGGIIFLGNGFASHLQKSTIGDGKTGCANCGHQTAYAITAAIKSFSRLYPVGFSLKVTG